MGLATAPVLDPHPECACAAVRKAARAVTQLYDLVLSPAGMKATQFTTLRAIAERGEIAQYRLAGEYGLSTETLSRRLANLRSKGLIELRIRGPRREHVYSITPAGMAVLQEATPYWEGAQGRFQQVLGADWRAVLEFCERVVAAAATAESLRRQNPGSGDEAAEGTFCPSRRPA